MSLKTHSKIYYGWGVDATNYQLDFQESGGELTADLSIGDYTLTEFCAEIARAMNEVAIDNVYSCSVDRSTRLITISADGNFKLLIASGSHNGTTVFETAGFTGADLTGTDSYDADTAGGTEYSTQFIIQDHISSEDYRNASDATVNKSASGRVEVFKFGEDIFVQANFRYVTDIAQPENSPIRNNSDGISDLRLLMRHMVSKAPFEYMEDESDPETFEKLILESTPQDAKGVGYKLNELYGQGLPNYWETGTLKLRVIP